MSLPFPPTLLSPKTPLAHPIIARLRRVAARRFRSVRAVAADRLTYLEPAALADLISAIRTAERQRLAGVFIEAGCALGGSAIVMAKAADRPLQVYDLFGMPPPPSAGDGPDVYERYAVIAERRSPGIGGNLYYGYVDDLFAAVQANFRRHGIDPDGSKVQFYRGMLQDTLHVTGPVAVAHIDCDRYESVRVCIERIAPMLVSGGVMIFDDYDAKSGCRHAVDEYFAARTDIFRIERRSRLRAVRR